MTQTLTHLPTTSVIVVVDDAQSFLDLVRDILQDEGYQVIACRAPDEAVARIRDVHPDLVMLHTVSGTVAERLEIVDAMRATPSRVATPVLILTADPRVMHEWGAEFNRLGVVVMDTPFALSELLTAIAALLGHTQDFARLARTVSEVSAATARVVAQYRAGQITHDEEIKRIRALAQIMDRIVASLRASVSASGTRASLIFSRRET